MGTFGKFECAMSTKTLDACYAATYQARSPVLLASDFVLEGIRFFPYTLDVPAKAKILTLDDLIPLKEERKLAATINAGALLGSKQWLKKL